MNKNWMYYFYEISKIPRESGHEEKLRDYLIKFAKDRNFKYYTDELYNVIIWKDACNSAYNEEIIGLQAHIDMVCEKTKDSNHNFSIDPIEVFEDNGYLKANGTSLGADNGIGVSYLLSILDSNEISHPKIEAIFTTQEETRMNGVREIDGSVLLSNKVISFDNFNEKELWIGSASSQEWYTKIKYKTMQLDNLISYKLDLTNFIGGHAGMDIGDERRGNPIKEAFYILKDSEVYINSIKAGSLINVIPRDCEIEFSIDKKDFDSLNKIKKNIKELNNKYILENIELSEINQREKVIPLEDSKKIINCINDLKIGAIKRDDNNNVIVGSNLAKIKSLNEELELNFCVRGNNRKLTDIFIDQIKNDIINKYNLIIEKYDEWSGYEQPIDNELIEICKKFYIEKNNESPNILGVQACLECEYLNQKIKDFQYVALGVNTFDVHSVNERVEIKSVNKMWKVIIGILDYYSGGKK